MQRSKEQAQALQILENWLNVLLNSYCHHPSPALAKVIHYYIDRVLSQPELNEQPLDKCRYLRMKKFWHWRS